VSPVSPDLSIVIPIRNEAASLAELHRELSHTMAAWGRAYELLLVDDGSTDGSHEILARLQATDPHLRVIRFRRNFGQTAAFAAGFDYARGRLVVTSDGDLQNDPRDSPAMIDLLERGDYDIVCGWRKDRKDPFLSRRLPSILANRLISVATGVHLHDYGCSLKVFRAEVVKPLKLYGEMHRFLPAIASEQGVTIAEMVVNHRERQHGRSNYGIGRTVRVILDLLTVKFLLNYSTRPLQFFGLMGGVSGALGLLICMGLAYEKLTNFEAVSLSNRPLLLLGAVLIVTGVQLVTIGLVAELQARTYHESQNKPIYIVRDVLETAAPGPGPVRIGLTS
jgi:glycosyltransferase involved in cell wall biosynthesis